MLEGTGDEAAAAYRAGSFFARPSDGERNIDMLVQCRDWLGSINAKYPGKTVVAFSHDTFQNGV